MPGWERLEWSYWIYSFAHDESTGVGGWAPLLGGTISASTSRSLPQDRKRIKGKLVQRGGALFLEIPKGYKLAPDAIEEAVRKERDSR